MVLADDDDLVALREVAKPPAIAIASRTVAVLFISKRFGAFTAPTTAILRLWTSRTITETSGDGT